MAQPCGLQSNTEHTTHDTRQQRNTVHDDVHDATVHHRPELMGATHATASPPADG